MFEMKSTTKSRKIKSQSVTKSPTHSHSSDSTTTRAQRRGSRTTNACEACKKRKTKCSGPSGPCEACAKVDTFCHFNMKLDTRRKVAYKPTAVRERQQYILEAVMHILKHCDAQDIQYLLKLIREEAQPQHIASCMRSNILDLQDRGILPAVDVDETDLVSLGLQGLYSHRAGRTGARHSTNRAQSFVPMDESRTPKSTLSSPTDSVSQASSFGKSVHESNQEIIRDAMFDPTFSFTESNQTTSSHTSPESYMVKSECLTPPHDQHPVRLAPSPQLSRKQVVSRQSPYSSHIPYEIAQQQFFSQQQPGRRVFPSNGWQGGGSIQTSNLLQNYQQPARIDNTTFYNSADQIMYSSDVASCGYGTYMPIWQVNAVA